MSFYTKNHPMLGSDSVFNAWKSRRQAATFKGTLFGIMVSFFIIIFLAYLLNLASNPSPKASEDRENYRGATEVKDERASQEGGGVSLAPLKAVFLTGFDWPFGSAQDILRQFFGIKTAQAATVYKRSDYKAQVFIMSAPKLELAPGEEAVFRVGFKNIGAAPWLNSGANFVSVYTFGPKYRKSVFQDNWYKPEQPVKLKDKTVKTGQLGYIEFKLKAPSKEGNYAETFKLAAEDKAWIEGGEVSIPIVVSKKVVKAQAVKPDVALPAPAQVTPLTPAIPAPVKPFQASVVSKIPDKAQVKSGETVDIHLDFKNEGASFWEMEGILVPDETLEDDGMSVFYLPTWASGHEPAVSGRRVSPGETASFDFKLKAPEAGGTFTAKFRLVVNYDKEVADSVAEIPITVAEEAAAADQSAGRVVSNLKMVSPLIEVGLSYMENNSDAAELTSDSAYQLTDKAGNLLASFSFYESARISYDFYNKIFTVQNSRLNLSAQGELHFKGLGDNTVFTITSMSRLTSDGINDNKYRDEILFRQADTTGRLWMINRLPMEHYLWGIAETSNISPLEYIKSIIVAARTYAIYHLLNPYKYNGYFTVVATTADQLYRGYQSELRRPRVVQAVNETAGQVITYQGDVVVTPYFGHSDGQTRTWSSVFGGKDKPWLQPVAAPYDAGLAMFGHGVGMSANDAYGHAKTDGWDYTKILKYYYNGIEVGRIY